MDRRRAIIAASSLLAGMAAGPLRQAWAATYPSRTIRLLVPFPPGGGTDLVARAIAEKISGRLGQRMIIENKSGGLGAIAQRELAAAPPDGHTLVMDSMAIVVFPHLMKKPLYDPVADLDAVALVNTFPFVIAVNPNVPVKSVRELIDFLRGNAGANVASAGATTRLAAELFRLETNVDMTFVSYRGGAPTMLAMLSGESHVYFGDIPTVINHIRSGRLRAIAVTSKTCSSVLPDVPTVAESGLPSYEFVSWNGGYALFGTPPGVLDLLNREFVRAAHEPDIVALLDSVGSVPGEGTAMEFAAFHRSQYAYWRDVVRRAKMPNID